VRLKAGRWLLKQFKARLFWHLPSPPSREPLPAACLLVGTAKNLFYSVAQLLKNGSDFLYNLASSMFAVIFITYPVQHLTACWAV
jgi:hypothetical protein